MHIHGPVSLRRAAGQNQRSLRDVVDLLLLQRAPGHRRDQPRPRHAVIHGGPDDSLHVLIVR